MPSVHPLASESHRILSCPAQCDSMYGRTKKSDVEFAEQQLIKRNRVSALNPLRKFPSSSDTFTRAIFGSQTSRLEKKVLAKEKWLDPDNVRPDFGVKVCMYICMDGCLCVCVCVCVCVTGKL